MRALDITGERYTRLVALRRLENLNGDAVWLFRCDCGVEVARRIAYVRHGNSGSCGCLNREKVKARSTKHGHTRGASPTPEYRSYSRMKRRCLNVRDIRYPTYGGAGIKVCDRWLDSFDKFLADMGPMPAPDYSIERIDNSGHYAPENCKWASRSEQGRNKRNNRFVLHEGEKVWLPRYAELMGVNYTTLRNRMRREGQSAPEAVEAIKRDPRVRAAAP